MEGRIELKILTDKARGRRPVGRPICRWVDNIRMDLKEKVSIQGLHYEF